jgi:murein DD-endopeptidase MepM/ murein hydrolase activator NlpD
MKQSLALLFVILVSCAPAPIPQVVPTSTVTVTTITSLPATPTSSRTPTPPPGTATPEPCDPFEADYCITSGHFILVRPIMAPSNTFVDHTYRYASDANNTREPHHGVEFLDKFGTPVHAAGDGVVLFADADKQAIYSPWSNFYGNVVVIEHTDDLYTLYAHLSRITVEAGQTVFAGDQIGEVGQSGVATGPHLHFEVRQGDAVNYFSTQNPELWLVPNFTGDGHLMGAVQVTILNPENELVRFAEVSLQKYDDEDQPVGDPYYSVTYPDQMLTGKENFAMSDLPAGRYRLVINYMGWYVERWVEVESGKLTDVIFRMNY